MSCDLGDDILDSRDVEGRIDDLQDELENTPYARDDITAAEIDSLKKATPKEWFDALDKNDEIEELRNWLALREEATNYNNEWRDNAVLILDTYWEAFAAQEAKEFGSINDDIPSWIVIDWNASADNLKVDYTELDAVDGNIYWVRNT